MTHAKASILPAPAPAPGVSGRAPDADADADPDSPAPWTPRAPRLPLVQQLRERLADRTAAWLAARGVGRIALYPGGRHARALVRQPWRSHGLEVVAILDDAGGARTIAGVPVVRPTDVLAWDDADRPRAVVLCTTEYEDRLGERARAVLGGSGVEVVRLYTPDDAAWEAGASVDRLVGLGLSEPEASWLVAHRGERHDALLPVLPAARTELHARRYELAAALLAEHAPGGRVADVACGTGYGAELLVRAGGAGEVVGVDVDERAVAYAGRRHGVGGRARFVCADACATGLASGGFDFAVSFETIEHVRDAQGLVGELARLTGDGGRAIVSTPNALGPTPYHVHDFDMASFEAVLASRFDVVGWFGQRAVDECFADDLPPGVWRLGPAARDGVWEGGGGRPEILIAECVKRGGGVGGVAAVSPDAARWAASSGTGVLWDAAGLGAGVALAAARAGARGVVVLDGDPRGHLRNSEALADAQLAGARALGLSLAGLGGAGPQADAGVIASLAGMLPARLHAAPRAGAHWRALSRLAQDLPLEHLLLSVGQGDGAAGCLGMHMGLLAGWRVRSGLGGAGEAGVVALDSERR